MSYEEKYKKYKFKYLNELQKIKQKGGTNKSKLIAFTAKWCGHCKTFMPVFNKLQKNSKLDIEFINYDSELNKEEIKKYKILGYPTLYLQHNNKMIEYTGERSVESIENFIKNTIN
jgi:thiol-disulfide isomerase/thioredoxin